MTLDEVKTLTRPWIPRRYGNGSNGTQWQSPNFKLFLSYGGDIFTVYASAGPLSVSWDAPPERREAGRRRREEKRNAQTRT